MKEQTRDGKSSIETMASRGGLEPRSARRRTQTPGRQWASRVGLVFRLR